MVVGIGRVVRDQLGNPVNLRIGHLQHTPDIAKRRTRLQRTEGDDLRHPVIAVFFLNIGDHLVAPVLTEINVEIRHRDPFGIEESFEKQAPAERVEIGDRQCPGDDRTGAGPAARPDRDILALRPLDEIGNDQEITGNPIWLMTPSS